MLPSLVHLKQLHYRLASGDILMEYDRVNLARMSERCNEEKEISSGQVAAGSTRAFTESSPSEYPDVRISYNGKEERYRHPPSGQAKINSSYLVLQRTMIRDGECTEG